MRFNQVRCVKDSHHTSCPQSWAPTGTSNTFYPPCWSVWKFRHLGTGLTFQSKANLPYCILQISTHIKNCICFPFSNGWYYTFKVGHHYKTEQTFLTTNFRMTGGMRPVRPLPVAGVWGLHHVTSSLNRRPCWLFPIHLQIPTQISHVTLSRLESYDLCLFYMISSSFSIHPNLLHSDMCPFP